MKKVKLLAAAILTAGLTSAFAAPQDTDVEQQKSQTTTQQELKNSVSPEIQQLVEQVKNAPPSEKYIYMNQLKQKLRELSADERREVMQEVVKDLRHGGKEEAIEHVAGKNERAEKEVMEEHETMKGENRNHSEENMEMRTEMEMEGKQEKMMEREHELEERKTDIQERTNFRQTEMEEREMEHQYESGSMDMNQGDMGGNNQMEQNGSEGTYNQGNMR